jgi:hypothetical protein
MSAVAASVVGWIRYAYFVLTLLLCAQAILRASFLVGAGALLAFALCFFSTATFVGSFLARCEHNYSRKELGGIGAIALVLCVAGIALLLWSGFWITLSGVQLSGLTWGIVGIVIAAVTTRKKYAL